MTLPSFTSPPVVETVLGIEFESPEQFTSPYFGLFWQRIRDSFPNPRVQPPLASRLPRPGLGPPDALTLSLSDSIEVRYWFESEAHDSLVQIQRDRLIFNWRKSADSKKYPRYSDTTKPTFCKVATELSEFFIENGFGPIAIKQCEVTYINHLDRGVGWDSTSDLSQVFRIFQRNDDVNFLPEPEKLSLQLKYPMPEELGHLSFSATPGVRTSDGSDIMQLNVSAVGCPKRPDLESAIDWLDLGREWVVKGFTDFTTPDMHKLWGREQ